MCETTSRTLTKRITDAAKAETLFSKRVWVVSKSADPKPKAGRPPIVIDERAKRARLQLIRSRLRKRKITIDQLHAQAAKKFGEAVMSLTSYQRLLTKRAPTETTETVSQVFELLGITEEDIAKRANANTAKAMADVLPGGSDEIVPYIKRAARASADEVADMSRQLMETRHGSFHAFLTLWLLSEK